MFYDCSFFFYFFIFPLLQVELGEQQIEFLSENVKSVIIEIFINVKLRVRVIAGAAKRAQKKEGERVLPSESVCYRSCLEWVRREERRKRHLIMKGRNEMSSRMKSIFEMQKKKKKKP